MIVKVLTILGEVYNDDDDDDDDDNNNNNSSHNYNHAIFEVEQFQNHSQSIGEARYQGNAENSHIGHSTHTAESASVKVQNIIQHGK
jgi:hypothetical protein